MIRLAEEGPLAPFSPPIDFSVDFLDALTKPGIQAFTVGEQAGEVINTDCFNGRWRWRLPRRKLSLRSIQVGLDRDVIDFGVDGGDP